MIPKKWILIYVNYQVLFWQNANVLFGFVKVFGFKTETNSNRNCRNHSFNKFMNPKAKRTHVLWIREKLSPLLKILFEKLVGKYIWFLKKISVRYWKSSPVVFQLKQLVPNIFCSIFDALHLWQSVLAGRRVMSIWKLNREICIFIGMTSL